MFREERDFNRRSRPDSLGRLSYVGCALALAQVKAGDVKAGGGFGDETQDAGTV